MNMSASNVTVRYEQYLIFDKDGAKAVEELKGSDDVTLNKD